MRAVIQRVSRASVIANGKLNSEIDLGLVVLLGIEHSDGEKDIDWLAQKIANLRIFSDAAGIPNLNVCEAEGEILLVSQFTLHALTKKGNRPSYMRAAPPEVAEPIYNAMLQKLRTLMPRPVGTGVFGADMQLYLVNDGPLTIILDTQNKDF
jgi:D-tyrosyl-tRNA(Tyr) deacylase